jgi:hypothetical protein
MQTHEGSEAGTGIKNPKSPTGPRAKAPTRIPAVGTFLISSAIGTIGWKQQVSRHGSSRQLEEKRENATMQDHPGPWLSMGLQSEPVATIDSLKSKFPAKL